MHLELSDEETAALTHELHDIVESDRYPFSRRIRPLRAILGKLRPEPMREPSPPPKVVRAATIGLSSKALRWPVARRRKVKVGGRICPNERSYFLRPTVSLLIRQAPASWKEAN
jgi:hypothetical protein